MSLGIIAVTGASGLLGANLVAEFSARGERVVAQYLNHPIHFPNVECVRCDIGDPEQLHSLIHDTTPAWIIHGAAATNVDWCELNPAECYRINAEATRRIAADARSVGARLVYISTDAVFDGDEGGYQEGDRPRPVNIYGKSKLEGEFLAQSELASVLIIRTNIYGWNVQDKISLAEWILQRLFSNADVPGFEDVRFSPLLVNDIAHLLLEMMARPFEGIYHAGSHDNLSKWEFALRIARTFGCDDGLIHRASIAHADMPARRPLKTWLCVDKLERAIGSDMPIVQSGISRLKALFDNGFRSWLKSAETLGMNRC